MTKTAKAKIEAPTEPVDKPKPKRAVAATPAASTAPSAAVAMARAYSPPEILFQALQVNASIEVIEKLAELAERWEVSRQKREASAAWSRAFVAAKAKINPILRNRHVSFEAKDANKPRVDYWHEDLAAVEIAVAPALAEVGMAYHFRLEDLDGGRFRVTCVLVHELGHFEEAYATGARDTSGLKNDLQGAESARSYLKRATLKAVLGLSVGDRDNDGRTAPNEQIALLADTIGIEDLEKINALIKEGDLDVQSMCDWLGVPDLRHLPQKDFPRLERALIKRVRGKK